LISPDRLVADGFLAEETGEAVPDFPTALVDFGPVIDYKRDLLRQAHAHFLASGRDLQREAYDRFCQNTAYWLDDFALFKALEEHHKDQDGGVWNTWPKPIARRQIKAMKQWTSELAGEIGLHKFQQFL